MRRMQILSRKVRYSVQRSVEKLLDGSFTEVCIKELMIDLRETARAGPKIGLDHPQYKKTFSDFVEICDFIAHSNRDKGLFEEKIRATAELMADALASNDEAQWQRARAIRLPLDIYSAITGMLATAFLLLCSFDKSLPTNYLVPAYARREEIALCIVSLLQDSVIRLREKRGLAALRILAYRGFIRLYCQIHGSRIHHDAMRRTGGGGRLIVGFPVISTFAVDSDFLFPIDPPELFTQPPTARVHPIYETFRAPSGKLCLRPLNDD